MVSTYREGGFRLAYTGRRNELGGSVNGSPHDQGTVVSIYIARAATAPMFAVDQVRALVGRGLEGDRYFHQAGTYSMDPQPGREITLIESEAVEAAARETGIDFAAADSRRNIVTRGIALNDLVGQEFTVGDVRMKGSRLCDPCEHMVQLCGKHVLRNLVGRGGLRADVLTEGLIRVGDDVRVLSPVEGPGRILTRQPGGAE